MRKIIFVLLIISIIIFSGCSKQVSEEKKIYKADKDICGSIVFVKNIAPDFESALKLIEDQEKELYPGDEVVITAKKAEEVTDSNGVIVDLDLYFIHVTDKESGQLISTVSNVIDLSGNLYYVNWCPD